MAAWMIMELFGVPLLRWESSFGALVRGRRQQGSPLQGRTTQTGRVYAANVCYNHHADHENCHSIGCLSKSNTNQLSVLQRPPRRSAFCPRIQGPKRMRGSRTT